MTGSLIREARKAEGLTQAALARRLGITQPAIARLEAAGDEVTVATLQRALNAMGRALVLQVVERPSSVDETLLYRRVGRPPGKLIERFERDYTEVQTLVRNLESAAEWRDLRPTALLRALAHGEVDFVVVGGLAAVGHGSAVITRDLDITYAPDDANLERLGKVLAALDARLRGVAEDVPFIPDGPTLLRARLLTLDTQHGWLDLRPPPEVAPVYEQLRARATPAEVAGVKVWIASLDDLIAMKKAAGRPKDLVAVEELEAIQRLQRGA